MQRLVGESSVLGRSEGGCGGGCWCTGFHNWAAVGVGVILVGWCLESLLVLVGNGGRGVSGTGLRCYCQTDLSHHLSEL